MSDYQLAGACSHGARVICIRTLISSDVYGIPRSSPSNCRAYKRGGEVRAVRPVSGRGVCMCSTSARAARGDNDRSH